jgi:hypothetical protein
MQPTMQPSSYPFRAKGARLKFGNRLKKTAPNTTRIFMILLMKEVDGTISGGRRTILSTILSSILSSSTILTGSLQKAWEPLP